MNGKSNMRKWAALLLVVVLAIMAAAPAAPAQARNDNPGVIPPQAHPHGHTYGEWAAKWWQWAASIPTTINPILDETGAYCGENQSGPVWYLTTNAGGTTTRHCTIPPGKAILFMVMGAECSVAEPPPFHGNNEAELRACARAWTDQVTESLIVVDGVPVQNMLTAYRFTSPLYTLTLPPDNVLGVPDSTTISVADGYLVMLNPLPPGEHTIYARGAQLQAGLQVELTYHLTVGH